MSQRTFSRSLPWRFALAALLIAALIGGAVPTNPVSAEAGVTPFTIPATGSTATAITRGSDGNVWFLESAANKVGVITPAGDITQYDLPATDPKSYLDDDMTAGPDGNLWFTLGVANKVGRITPAGVTTQYDVPSAKSGLGRITAGPDGNLWFTETLTGKIGKITVTGAITEYPVPGDPGGITAGPDGNLWVIWFRGDTTQVRKVTPDGGATDYPLPVPAGVASGGADITAGPDGNLWLAIHAQCGSPTGSPCTPNALAIIRLTVAGQVTLYPIPLPPIRIAVGPDGNLWYTTEGRALGRITPAGELTSFAVAGTYLTTGADGNLWLALATEKTILRVQPDQLALPAAPSPTSAFPTRPMCTPFAPNSPFAAAGFHPQWQQGEALAPNFWGPTVTTGLQELYREAPGGGQRLVQYFDKGRMELTNPTTGTVTNGLLATELISGKIQAGDSRFQPYAPATIPIAGDPDNPGPTYAGLASNGASLFAPTTAKPGSYVTLIAAADGSVTDGGGFAGISMTPAISGFDATTQHNVLGAFAAYRDRVGVQTVGYAISEPFRATVKVAGTSVSVVVQVFERRVLTYTASNPDPYQVEMGNIGQHYYQWRYCSSAG
ncbi:MAG: Vgb family protein [Thermomicrobiales bacterium]